MPRNDLIQLRAGTAAAWTSANPTLDAGEPGFESDTGKQKIGDGATAWTSLPYTTDVSRLPTAVVSASSASGDAFGRTQVLGTSTVKAPALKQLVSVTDAPWSAVGDGVTDDTTAVQGMLTAAQGVGSSTAPARLVFPHTPNAAYLCGNLTVPDNVVLEGPGRLLRKAGATGPWFTSTSSSHSHYLTSSGLTYDFSNYTANTDPGVTYGWEFLNGTSDITFTDNNFVGHNSYCCFFQNGSLSNRRLRFFDNRLRTNTDVNWDTNAIVFFEAYDVQAERNRFYGGGGIDIGLSNVIALVPPTLGSPSLSSGGSFTAGTYYWTATCIGNGGETIGSNEVTTTVTSNQQVSLGVTVIPAGTDAIRLYRAGSSGGETTNPAFVGALDIAINQTTATFVDTGVVNSYENIGASIGQGYAPSTAPPARGGNVRVCGNIFEWLSATCIGQRVLAGAEVDNVVIDGNLLLNCGYYFASAPLTVISDRKGLIAIADIPNSGNSVLRNATLSNNTIKYCLGVGIVVGHYINSGEYGACENITITGNTIDGFTLGGAIDPNHIGQGISVQNITRSTISSNTIRGVGGSGIEHPGGTSSEVTISFNVIDTVVTSSDAVLGAGQGFQAGGIALHATIDNLIIAFNLVRNTHNSGTVGTTMAGIVCNASGNVNNVLVIGNRVFDDRGTQYMQYALNIGNGAGGSYPTNWRVYQNDFSNGAGASGTAQSEPIKYYASNPATNLYSIQNNAGSTADTVASASLASRIAVVTATNTSWPIPAAAQLSGVMRITAIGGHGAGGGGGSAAASQLQVGGAGGVAATFTTVVVNVGSNTTLNVTIGAGATGGNGGAAGGSAGTGGAGAGATTIAGTGISIAGRPGPSGNGSAASSTTAVSAASGYGSSAVTLTNSQGGPGRGGGSGQVGGDPLGHSPGGAGGGGPATTTLGGGGGSPGTYSGAGAAGASGASGTAAGVAGTSGGAWGTATYGPGGGGGGGAAGTGAGGNGGSGSSGVAILEW